MARINVIQYEEATAPLKETYDRLIEKRGKLSEVLKIQSLYPKSIESHVQFYMDIMFGKTALSRAEKELVAVVVSAVNGCVYCCEHHGAALNAYWKDSDKVLAVSNNFRSVPLSERELAICEYAVLLTSDPGAHKEKDHTKGLRDVGCTDEAILDVTLVTSYFNFVNRMVLSLGVQLEAEKGEGYKY